MGPRRNNLATRFSQGLLPHEGVFPCFSFFFCFRLLVFAFKKGKKDAPLYASFFFVFFQNECKKVWKIKLLIVRYCSEIFSFFMKDNFFSQLVTSLIGRLRANVSAFQMFSFFLSMFVLPLDRNHKRVGFRMWQKTKDESSSLNDIRAKIGGDEDSRELDPFIYSP